MYAIYTHSKPYMYGCKKSSEVAKLFSIYLAEQNIHHVLLPALDFMTIDSYDEPQIGAIKVKLAQHLYSKLEMKCIVFG